MASNTPNPTKSNKDDAQPASVPAIMAPPPTRDRPWTRSTAGIIGLATLSIVLLACILTTPYTFGITRIYIGADESGNPIYQSAGQRFDAQNRLARHIPPTWWPGTNAWGAPTKLHNLDQPPTEDDTAANRYRAAATDLALRRLAKEKRTTTEELTERGITPTPQQIRAAAPTYILGTDLLGRDLFVRALAGGAISLGIGIAAAILSVIIGTLYGMIAGYAGGRTDAVMMRTVDVLFGLPYVLLVVLLAVAGDAVVGEHISRAKARETWVINQARIQLTEQNAAPATTAQARDHLAENPDLRAEIETPLWNAIRWLEAQREKKTSTQPSTDPIDPEQELLPPPPTNLLADANRLRPRTITAASQQRIDLSVLLVAIAGVSWLTMARVIRGQVLTLKAQPFVEASRAMGAPVQRQFIKHLLPNLVGPIVVYATLTVPQAILQESFLSFLGIGVQPPVPSWGNLAADGLYELNPYKSHWWLLLFPCILLGITLLALNFVGEGLREAVDPRRARRR